MREILRWGVRVFGRCVGERADHVPHTNRDSILIEDERKMEPAP